MATDNDPTAPPTGTVKMTLYLPADVDRRLKRAATKAHRTRNAQVVFYVEDGMVRDGIGEEKS